MFARTAVLVLMVAVPHAATAQKRPARKAAPAQAEQRQEEQQRQQEEEDKVAIEDLHQKELNARMSYDVDAIAELCDDDVVMLPPEHPPIQGKEAYRAYLQQGAKGFQNVEILAYNQQWQEVHQLGDYAYEWGSIEMRTRPAGAQNESQATMDVVRVLKRQPSGAWKIYRSIWNAAHPTQALAPEKKPLEEVPKKQ